MPRTFGFILCLSGLMQTVAFADDLQSARDAVSSLLKKEGGALAASYDGCPKQQGNS